MQAYENFNLAVRTNRENPVSYNRRGALFFDQKRYEEAYKYAKMLSNAGNHEGTRRVADYYYEGKGVSRDKRLAKDLYYEAARAGNKEAKEKLRGL